MVTDSSRAEISAQLTGLKFHTGFWNKSSENQIVDYIERDSARGEIQPGLKIIARYSLACTQVILLGIGARPYPRALTALLSKTIAQKKSLCSR